MDLVMSQHNPYSLEVSAHIFYFFKLYIIYTITQNNSNIIFFINIQPAVDALHRHEQTQAQKLLLKEYENPRYTNTNADEYYNDGLNLIKYIYSDLKNFQI